MEESPKSVISRVPPSSPLVYLRTLDQLRAQEPRVGGSSLFMVAVPLTTVLQIPNAPCSAAPPPPAVLTSMGWVPDHCSPGSVLSPHQGFPSSQAAVPGLQCRDTCPWQTRSTPPEAQARLSRCSLWTTCFCIIWRNYLKEQFWPPIEDLLNKNFCGFGPGIHNGLPSWFIYTLEMGNYGPKVSMPRLVILPVFTYADWAERR